MNLKEAIKLAKIDLSKRKQAEQLVYDYFAIVDPTGKNTARYREMFASMSDKKFEEFMWAMFNDFNMNYVFDIEDYKVTHTIESAEKALKFLGVPIEETIVMPWLNMDQDNPAISKYPMITGYDIELRMQQTNHKKNSTSTKISERSATTGQVVGHDKNARSSDQENNALIAIGAVNIARELNGFRADGLGRKAKAYGEITRSGSCSLEDVEADFGVEDRTTLNTIDVLFTSMGIKTDLVSKDYLLRSTVSGKSVSGKDLMSKR